MKEMENKIHQAMEQQCQKRGFATPVDVLMDIGTLDRASYDAWRAGRVPFLEAVCHGNLHKLSEILRIMRTYAAKKNWKPSFTCYKHKSLTLRFSKSRNPSVEKAYATHYVAKKKEQKVSEPPANLNSEIPS